MQTVLLGVHPQYADQIVEGDRQYHLLKQVVKPIEKKSRILIYSNPLVDSIIGECKLERILRGDAKFLMKKTGLIVNEFEALWCGSEAEKNTPVLELNTYALKLSNPVSYNRNVTLREIKNIDSSFKPPTTGYKILDKNAEYYDTLIKLLNQRKIWSRK